MRTHPGEPSRAGERAVRSPNRPGSSAVSTGVLLLALSGCGGSGPFDPVDAFLAASPQVGVPTVHLVPEDDPRPWPMDPWTFRSHALHGDTLTLSIEYGGGCHVHRFALLVDPAFRESHPVQVSARLAHDADGDPCRALILEDLRFDLAPLRRHYQDAYGQGPGTIAIVLAGRQITYEF
jgi:hypothetical protein